MRMEGKQHRQIAQLSIYSSRETALQNEGQCSSIPPIKSYCNVHQVTIEIGVSGPNVSVSNSILPCGSWV